MRTRAAWAIAVILLGLAVMCCSVRHCWLTPGPAGRARRRGRGRAVRGRGRRRCRAPILARRARPPQRKPGRAGHGLDVTAVAMRFAGVPQVNGLAPDACRLLPAPAGGDDLAVQDHERCAIGQCPRQRVRQLGRLRGQYLYHLVDIAVAGARATPWSLASDSIAVWNRPRVCPNARPGWWNGREPIYFAEITSLPPTLPARCLAWPADRCL